MEKLTGFVTITRTLDDGRKGEAVAYTKDGSWFDEAVVTKTPIFDSNMYVGGVWISDEILKDDEVREATKDEIAFFKLRAGDYLDGEGSKGTYQDYIDSRKAEIEFTHDGEVFDSCSIVPSYVAEKACKMALRELARTLLEMKDMNLAADMLGRIRDEKI